MSPRHTKMPTDPVMDRWATKRRAPWTEIPFRRPEKTGSVRHKISPRSHSHARLRVQGTRLEAKQKPAGEANARFITIPGDLSVELYERLHR